jgi:hypothetical protein
MRAALDHHRCRDLLAGERIDCQFARHDLRPRWQPQSLSNTLNKSVSLAAGSQTLTIYARSNGTVTDKRVVTFTVR